MNLLAVAKRYLAAGFSIIPIRGDGSKAPDSTHLPRDEEGKPTWKPFQERLPMLAECALFFKSCAGIAIICGLISRFLEVIDFDAEGFYERWREAVERVAPGLVDTLPHVRTPSGGMHVYIRSAGPIEGNLKLAWHLQDGKRKIAIETRGEGGYVCAPGCDASVHSSGKRYEHVKGSPGADAVPVLSAKERAILLNAARSLNEVAESVREPSPGPSASGAHNGTRPGDDFNRRSSWEEILGPHGWQKHHEGRDGACWTRPGKNPREGWSATTDTCKGQDGGGLFYVFSSNASPFEPETCYSKFSAFAVLERSGDYASAARALAARGFGEKTARASASAASNDNHHADTGAANDGKEEVVENEEEGSTPLLLYEPPPLEVLPAVLRDFVEAIARAMRVDPGYVLPHALAACSGAVGIARVLRISSTHVQPPILWFLVVSPTGSRKSPPFREAINPLRMMDSHEWMRFQDALKEYKVKALVYETVLRKWKNKQFGPPPEEPEAPLCRAYLVDDITLEKLADELKANPRGLLFAIDELAGFFNRFDAYRPGKGGDLQRYLSMYDGDTVKVSRKTSGTTRLRRAAVNITGTIQKPTVKRYATPEFLETGFFARFRFIFPPPALEVPDDVDVPDHVVARFRRVLKRLASLEMEIDENGEPAPIEVRLSQEANAVRRAWLARWLEVRRELPDDSPLGAAAAKLEAIPAREGFLFALIEWADGETAEPDPVNREAIEAAVEMALWHWREERRVYRYVLGAGKALPFRLLKLVRYLERQDKPVRAHEVASGLRQYAGKVEQAEQDLEELVRLRLARRIEPLAVGEKGGRPQTPLYELNTRPRHVNPRNSAQDGVLHDNAGGAEEKEGGLHDRPDGSEATPEPTPGDVLEDPPEEPWEPIA